MTGQRFDTDRLRVSSWLSQLADAEGRADAAIGILTPAVTRYLPAGWQGEYNRQRALKWLADRERESELLLATRLDSAAPVGFLIVMRADSPETGATLRIGFALAESAWGQGLGTELLAGFTGYCRGQGVDTIIGGVEEQNTASQRLLTNCGFVRSEAEGAGIEYRLKLA